MLFRNPEDSFRILKLAMTYQQQKRIDYVFFTCCILHNMLHTYDGMDGLEENVNWVGSAELQNTWEHHPDSSSVGAKEFNEGGLSLSDESFPNEGARGAFAKPSRSLQEGSAKPSRSVSSRRLRGASKAQPRTLRGGLRTLRGGCTYRRLHEDALEGSRGLLEGSVNELRVPTRSWL